jgi:hypothetical protein
VGGAVGLAVLATLALRHAGSAVAHGVVSTVASTDGAALAFRAAAVVALAGGVIVALVPFGGPSGTAVSSPASDRLDPLSAGDIEPAPAQ